MNTALVALGSSLEHRRGHLEGALEELESHRDVHAVHASRFYRTLPVGGDAESPLFLNAAARLQTTLSPPALLAELHRIEARHHRERSARWGPRTLDLDLILQDDECIERDELRLPHPRMISRRFVLAPSSEVAPEMRHPVCKWTVSELLANLDAAPRLMSLTGPISFPVRWNLLEALVPRLPGRILLPHREGEAAKNTEKRSGSGPHHRVQWNPASFEDLLDASAADVFSPLIRPVKELCRQSEREMPPRRSWGVAPFCREEVPGAVSVLPQPRWIFAVLPGESRKGNRQPCRPDLVRRQTPVMVIRGDDFETIVDELEAAILGSDPFGAGEGPE
jgi:2-amino-4-hydroxy-6-hydroxymethyldihydropteridine diphosphokinase